MDECRCWAVCSENIVNHVCGAIIQGEFYKVTIEPAPTVLCNVRCSAVKYITVQCSAVQCSAVQCTAVHYSALQ